MHFSRVTDIPRLASMLKAQIGELVRIARRHAVARDRNEAIKTDMLDLWHGLAREHGVAFDRAGIERVLRGDLELNAQGLIIWLDRNKASS
jgi:hypothetical protein